MLAWLYESIVDKIDSCEHMHIATHTDKQTNKQTNTHTHTHTLANTCTNTHTLTLSHTHTLPSGIGRNSLLEEPVLKPSLQLWLESDFTPPLRAAEAPDNPGRHVHHHFKFTMSLINPSRESWSRVVRRSIWPSKLSILSTLYFARLNRAFLLDKFPKGKPKSRKRKRSLSNHTHQLFSLTLPF